MERIKPFIADVVARLRDTGAEIHVDRLGNVTATFCGKKTQRALLVFAHLDEIGLIVKGIDKNGFLRVERIGGVPEKTLLGTFVDVHTMDNTKSVTGCMGCYSHHTTPPEKKMSVPSIKEMYIDLGCESREEVLALGIEVLKNAIPFTVMGSMDETVAVRVVFMLMLNDFDSQIDLLQRLMQVVLDDSLLEQLLQTKEPARIRELVGCAI